jgi:hypothetical protein
VKNIDVEQYSPEYWAAKLGKPSSSKFGLILTTKGEKSAQAKKYMLKLAGERVAGVAEETYQNGVMRRGLELEAEAREYYEFITGQEVRQVGFCLADEGPWGASPDGLIGEEGCLEIKCPTMAVHVGYLLGGVLPSDYFQQVQGQLAVTGRPWVDFLSYYPGLPHLLVRVGPEKPFIQALKRELADFCAGIDRVEKQIRGKT